MTKKNGQRDALLLAMKMGEGAKAKEGGRLKKMKKARKQILP